MNKTQRVLSLRKPAKLERQNRDKEMNKIILPITMAAVLLLTSCSSEDFLGGNNNAATVPLTIADVSTNNNVSYVVSRAAIDGTTLPSGSSIGLYLCESGSTTYDEETVSNKKYTYSTSWAAESGNEIMLSATAGNLYAYYPYQSTADASAVTLSASIDGDDFCWGATSSAVSASSPKATLTLNHKLTRIDVTVKRDTYTGTGSLSSITLSGSNITTSGSMAPTTGTVTPNSAAAFTQAVTGYSVATDNTNTIKCLLVPVSETASNVTLKCTIDGTEYTTTIPSLSLGAGKKYDVTVMLNKGGLTVTGTEVGTWDPINKTITVGGYTVTLVNAGSIANNVTVNSASKGAYGVTANGSNTLTIVSMPTKSGYWVSRPTSITDKGATTQNNFTSATSSLSNGVRTTTITGITGDVTVTFDSNNDGLSLAVPYVDLGLESGTRWAQCNLGVASPYNRADYGNYYMWAATAATTNPATACKSWSNGPYYYSQIGTIVKWSKYTTDKDNAKDRTPDDKTSLDIADDAAYQIWGSDWRIPSDTIFNELRQNTTSSQKTESSHAGYLLTSSQNSATIFIPFAGYYDRVLGNLGSGSACACWTRNLTSIQTLSSGSNGQAIDYVWSTNTTLVSAGFLKAYRVNCNSIRPVLHSDALSKTYK